MMHKIKKWLFWRGITLKDMLLTSFLLLCLMGTISFFIYLLVVTVG